MMRIDILKQRGVSLKNNLLHENGARSLLFNVGLRSQLFTRIEKSLSLDLYQLLLTLLKRFPRNSQVQERIWIKWADTCHWDWFLTIKDC